MRRFLPFAGSAMELRGSPLTRHSPRVARNTVSCDPPDHPLIVMTGPTPIQQKAFDLPAGASNSRWR